jgi:peptidoglycan/LPS O-acetylase OafA/YrhL
MTSTISESSGLDRAAAQTKPSSGRSGPFGGRVIELDGIRGIAIVLVLIWHYAVILLSSPPGSVFFYLQRGLSLSWSGVDLFFVLSGFLIGGILLDNKDASNYFRVFYTRRICRIFPLYFAWLLLFIVLIALVPSPGKSVMGGWLFDAHMPLWTYATFTQNIAMAVSADFGSNWLSATWSLAVEEQFYLVLPPLIFLLTRRQIPRLLVILVTVALALRYGSFLVLPHPRFASYVLMPSRADALMLGVLCAYAVRQRRVLEFLKRRVGWMYLVFAILFADLGFSIFTSRWPVLGPFAMRPYGYSVLALFYSCFLLIAVTEERGILSAIARIRWLRGLGAISYGIYMIHIAVIGAMHGLLLKQSPQINSWRDAVVTLAALLCTLAIAILSWRFFERPILSIGHSIQYEHQTQGQAAQYAAA